MVLTRWLPRLGLFAALGACVDVRQRTTVDVLVAPVPDEARVAGRQVTLQRAELHIAELRIADADPERWGLEPPGGSPPLIGHAPSLGAVDLLAGDPAVAGTMLWTEGNPAEVELRWAGADALILEGQVGTSLVPFAMRLSLHHAVKPVALAPRTEPDEPVEALALHFDLWSALAAIPDELDGQPPTDATTSLLRGVTSRPALWHLEWR